MFLKLMSDQSLPDHDYRKDFELVECKRIQIKTVKDSVKVASISFSEDGCHFMDFPITKGNAYIINDEGRTISTASPVGF